MPAHPGCSWAVRDPLVVPVAQRQIPFLDFRLLIRIDDLVAFLDLGKEVAEVGQLGYFRCVKVILLHVFLVRGIPGQPPKVVVVDDPV
jgi:hypothetical protein